MPIHFLSLTIKQTMFMSECVSFLTYNYVHWSIYVLIQIVFRAVYASTGSVILLDNVHLQSSELAKCQDCPVAARFVTTARLSLG